ncbi:hypothetical protein HBA54_01260 [Pelagibius litoralis]|uniref:Uncharacterized protein n=1 Tax=Pelagibius litoralis TaxID=374515 RepID=A0A967C2Z7_9PROT|nr:hypothetical protein [Pelagibius litoralis]NIA67215.1 hypothetical protein [Pelagibius litoralis]
MQSYSTKRNGAAQLLPYLALFITWAMVHTSLIVFRDLPVFESGLVGPDSYMRMLRVTELYQNWDWFDGTIERANAPYGDTLHWTRPFDMLIMLIALPASLGMDFEGALYVAGILVSPLLQLTTGFALAWAMRPVIRPEVWFLPAVALFLQPGALAYSVAGRADHHSLLLLVFVVTAGFTLRALRNPLDARPAVWAGASAGFGIWLSVEFLLPMGVCLVALGMPWLFGEREKASQNKWFALAASLLLLAALFAERPLERFLEPSYDRVSTVQFLVVVSILLFWRAAESYENRATAGTHPVGRLLLGLFGVTAAGLLVNSIHPLFFAGPMAGVDPRIQPIWLDLVLEMRPLIPQDRDSIGSFIFFFGSGLLVVPFFARLLWQERRSSSFWTLAFIGFACLLLWLVAIKHIRFSGYAEVAFIMAFAVVFDRFLQWTHRIHSDFSRGILRGCTITVLLLGPLTVGTTLMVDKADAKDASGQSLTACDVGEVAGFLETDPRWTGSRQTILTFLDIGPELLYRTDHAVIGTPYHRNSDGIYDSYWMLTSSDPGAVRAMIVERGIGLILLCQSPAERNFFSSAGDSLYKQLSGGQIPSWAAEVALPVHLQRQARLFTVSR